jgi:hypothetical protein
VGIDFIKVDLPTLKQLQAQQQALQRDKTTSQDNSEKTSKTIIEYCCPHCDQVCTEAEVQQGFCTACDQS